MNRVVRYIITGDSAGAVKAMKETETAAEKAGKKLEETGGRLKSLGSGMSSFGHKLSALSLPLIAVGGYAIKSAMDFQTSMTQLQTQAGASAKEVKWLSRQVEGIKGLGEGPTELADALYPIESVGLRGSKAMDALKASAKGAQVSGAGLVEVADALSGALGANLKDVRNATGAMGIMNGIVGLGKMHLADLTEAMGTGVLEAGKKAGLGFRDVGAALDAMTRQGVPATVEATRLRTNLSQFEAPKGAALAALRSIGLEQFSLANDLRKPNGLVTALRDLHEHLQGVSKDEQGLVLAKAFGGARGSANVIGLLNVLKSMESIRGQLNTRGEAQLNAAFETRTKNASFQMAEALAQGKKALVGFGQVLIPVVIPALEKLAKFLERGIEWWKKLPKPLKDATIYFGLFLAAAGPMLIFFGNLISATGTVVGGIGKLVTLLGPAGADAEAAAGGTEAMAGAMSLLGDAIPLVALAAFIGLLAKTKPPKWLGGEGRSWLTEASHLLPFGPTTQNAGPSESAERRSLREAERRAGVSGKTSTPTVETWNAHTRKELEMFILTAHQQVHQAEGEDKPLQIKIDLDGKQLTEVVAKRIRNHPVHAKPIAEAVSKYSKAKAVGVG